MSVTTVIVQELIENQAPQVSCAGLKLCHFTTAHAQLKSRAFHRLCLPLARDGVRVNYVSPATPQRSRGIDFVSIPQGGSRVARALWNRALLRALVDADAQIYHFQDPELLPVALALKIFFKKRVIYDAYEDFPSMARESTLIPVPWRAVSARLVEMGEWLAAHFLDAVVTADPFTLRRLARTGGSRKLVFSNFPNLDYFPPPGPAPKLFDLVYRGGLSERAGTYDLLEAMCLLKSRARALRLLLIGYFDDAAAETALLNRIRKMGLGANVEICGRVPHERMASALSQARMGLCPLRATPKFALNVPVKVFECWACGLPVIASNLPPIRPYFRNTRAGLLFQAGNADDLARAIKWMLDHPGAADAMGKNGRAAVVERFNNRAEIRRFERLLAQVVAPSGKLQERSA